MNANPQFNDGHPVLDAANAQVAEYVQARDTYVKVAQELLDRISMLSPLSPKRMEQSAVLKCFQNEMMITLAYAFLRVDLLRKRFTDLRSNLYDTLDRLIAYHDGIEAFPSDMLKPTFRAAIVAVSRELSAYVNPCGLFDRAVMQEILFRHWASEATAIAFRTLVSQVEERHDSPDYPTDAVVDSKKLLANLSRGMRTDLRNVEPVELDDEEGHYSKSSRLAQLLDELEGLKRDLDAAYLCSSRQNQNKQYSYEISRRRFLLVRQRFTALHGEVVRALCEAIEEAKAAGIQHLDLPSGLNLRVMNNILAADLILRSHGRKLEGYKLEDCTSGNACRALDSEFEAIAGSRRLSMRLKTEQQS